MFLSQLFIQICHKIVFLHAFHKLKGYAQQQNVLSTVHILPPRLLITTGRKPFSEHVAQASHQPNVMYTRWNVLLVIAGLIILTNYFLLCHNKTQVRVSAPQYKKMYTTTSFLPYFQACCNPLFCSLDGEWALRNDISYRKLSYVLDTNMQLRMRKGWPTSLFHGDLRCGKRYPLARLLKYNNTEGYYSDIVSQCDGFSRAPCCKEDIGWCGRGPWYCACDSCTDYSKVIYAELYTWMHKRRCQYFDIDSNRSCAYLGQVFSSITFIGDSLVRHVFSSLLIHLTGDPQYGALKVDANARDRQFCGGENQFVDSSCHVKLATKWNEIQQNGKYCPLALHKPELAFVQAYSSFHAPLAMDVIRNKLHESRPLILMGIGIHDNFNTSKVISYYLDPIVQLIESSSTVAKKPLLIWLNTHSAGPLKPLSFQDVQGNSKIERFNTEMVDYCNRNSIIVFDTYNITKGVHSFDGTHYGSALNELKIKLIINGLIAIPNLI